MRRRCNWSLETNPPALMLWSVLNCNVMMLELDFKVGGIEVWLPQYRPISSSFRVLLPLKAATKSYRHLEWISISKVLNLHEMMHNWNDVRYKKSKNYWRRKYVGVGVSQFSIHFGTLKQRPKRPPRARKSKRHIYNKNVAFKDGPALCLYPLLDTNHK